jgi:Nuclease-related domain
MSADADRGAWATRQECSDGAETVTAYRRREHDRACRCDQADAGCPALAVQGLSRTRVQELAEEIWMVSTGAMAPVQPILDPRGSRPGASAQAAYRRRRHQEREQWRDGWRWRWRWGIVAAAVLGVGLVASSPLGPVVGWQTAVLAGLLAWWRLWFQPSANARFWRRQAAAQRRTAVALAQLVQQGWLVLHDVALPGWSASLDHLVIGPTGAWAIESWRHGWLPRRRKATSPSSGRGVAGGPRPDLSWKVEAVADSLAGTGIPVRPVLCLHSDIRPPGRRTVQGIPLVALRRLPDVVRRGPRMQPFQVERASARALEVLRPAA